jgi:DNA-directed RNA polymerase subunit K/omega
LPPSRHPEDFNVPETTAKNATLDLAIAKYDSKFRFVLLASTRAEQLLRGARPKLDTAPAKPTRLAMEELRHELVAWDYGPAPEVESAGADDEDAGADAAASE